MRYYIIKENQFAIDNKKCPGMGAKLVAECGFEPQTFRL